MSTWVLILVLYSANHFGSVATVPGFPSQATCEAAATAARAYMTAAFCIERPGK